MADRVATTSRHYAELYRKASDQLLTAQEDERRRLGMDLHDGVGQTLTALVLTLDAAEAELWADGDATAPAWRWPRSIARRSSRRSHWTRPATSPIDSDPIGSSKPGWSPRRSGSPQPRAHRRPWSRTRR